MKIVFSFSNFFLPKFRFLRKILILGEILTKLIEMVVMELVKWKNKKKISQKSKFWLKKNFYK